MNAAAAHRPHAMACDTLADRIDGALPQMQCTRCGYPDCRTYAEAIAAGAAGINQCPPGGAEGIARLARITGHTALPLDPAFGQEGPRHGAVIDEAWCIGCTLCLDACPTDAILGRSKRMHTVVPAHCTGCELCVPVCPVDCIAMVPATGTATGWGAWSFPQAASALQRYQGHAARRARQEGDGPAAVPTDASSGAAPPPARNALSPPEAMAAPSGCAPANPKRAMIAAALQRARALRGG